MHKHIYSCIVQVPFRFYIYLPLNSYTWIFKDIRSKPIIIEQLEYTPPLFWTRPVKPRWIIYSQFDINCWISYLMQQHHYLFCCSLPLLVVWDNHRCITIVSCQKCEASNSLVHSWTQVRFIDQQKCAFPNASFQLPLGYCVYGLQRAVMLLRERLRKFIASLLELWHHVIMLKSQQGNSTLFVKHPFLSPYHQCWQTASFSLLASSPNVKPEISKDD